MERLSDEASKKYRPPNFNNISLDQAKSYVHEETKLLLHQSGLVSNLCDKVTEKFLNKSSPGKVFVKIKKGNPIGPLKKSIQRTEQKIQDLKQISIQNKEDFHGIPEKIHQVRRDLKGKLKTITQFVEETKVLKHQIEFIANLFEEVQEKFLVKPGPGELFMRLNDVNPFSGVNGSLQNNKKWVKDLEETTIEQKQQILEIRKRISIQRADLSKKFKRVTNSEASFKYALSNVDEKTGLTTSLPWFDVMRAGKDGQADQVVSQPISEFVLNPIQISGLYHQLRARYRFLSDRRFNCAQKSLVGNTKLYDAYWGCLCSFAREKNF